MKRKFSFNELLYDERYEKNLIEKVVGLGVWQKKKQSIRVLLAKKNTNFKQSLENRPFCALCKTKIFFVCW